MPPPGCALHSVLKHIALIRYARMALSCGRPSMLLMDWTVSIGHMFPERGTGVNGIGRSQASRIL